MSHWADADRGEVHSLLWDYVQDLASTYMSDRLTAYELYLGMVGDTENVGVYPSRTMPSPTLINRGAHLQMNVTRCMIDTGEAKIAQARPRPYFLTYGGDFDAQEKAKTLQRFVDGMFDQARAYQIGSQALRDAETLGTGVIKIVSRHGKPYLERVLIPQILVDEALAHNGEPPELFERREVSKSVLKGMFKKHAAAIESLTAIDVLSGSTLKPDLVVVYEGWKLCAGKKGDKDYKPGRHVIIAQNCTLVDDEWERETYPFAFIHWAKSSVGFYGAGIPQRALGLQVEINRVLRSVSKNIHLHGNPRMLVEGSSKVNPAAITTGWGDILKWEGTRPELMSPQIMSPEVYSYLWQLFSKAFEMEGLSTQAAFAKKESGVTAGRAMRELSDIQADRLAPISQRYEEFYLDIARKLIQCVEEIHQTEGNLEVSVKAEDGGFAERIDWSDIRLDESEYVIQLFPANFLSRTPSGKLSDLDDLMSKDLVSPEQAKRLIDFPDIKGVLDEDNTPSDLYRKQVRDIMRFGSDSYVPPEPFDDLMTGMKIYKNAYLRYRMEEIEEDKLSLLRDWIEAADSLMQPQEPPMAPEAAAPVVPGPMPPPGMPV